MNADLSVAPEIAQFAQRATADPHPRAGTGTLGELARQLTTLAADPGKWWDQVRFDPGAPVTILLEGHAWLLVTPPGATSVCDCHLATLLAGEAAEDGVQLRHGRTRVHGQQPRGRQQTHVVTGTAAGFAVSLHLAVRTKG